MWPTKIRLIFLAFLIVSLGAPSALSFKASQSRGLASSWTVLPSRSLAGLHYIFKSYEYDEDESIVSVKGPVVEITEGEWAGSKVYPEGYSTEMDPYMFEDEQDLGQSVFQAVTGNGSSVGTAFLVGENMVLTNRHILSISPNERNWQCGKFSVLLNHRDERVGCEKVRYCSSQYDYCVVQLKKMSSGKSVGSEVKVLRLTNRVRTDKDLSLLHIGNAGGLGLQASRGRGITIKDGEFFHYAPTLGGSSGAPLFNEKGEVIGLNWAHTGGEDYIGDASYNRGVLAITIYNELKKTHLYTLREIKTFKYWHRRDQTHRQVSIHQPD